MKQSSLFPLPERGKQEISAQRYALFVIPVKRRSVRGELLLTIFKQQKMMKIPPRKSGNFAVIFVYTSYFDNSLD